MPYRFRYVAPQAWVDSAPGVPDPAAIVRVFGDKSDLFIDRTRDLKVR